MIGTLVFVLLISSLCVTGICWVWLFLEWCKMLYDAHGFDDRRQYIKKLDERLQRMKEDNMNKNRRGFTLIELMVVLVIIAILVSLLLPAINAAVRTARNASQTSELQVIAQALANYKERYGDYPPSRVVLDERGNLSDKNFDANLTPAQAVIAKALASRSLSAMQRLAPRAPMSRSGPTMVDPVAWYDFNGNGKYDAVPVILDGTKCLVFFLGGIPERTISGFSMSGWQNYPQNPFVSATFALNRRPQIMEFNNSRLYDKDGNGFPSYRDQFSTDVNPVPIVYFATNGGGGYDPEDNNGTELINGYPVATSAFYAPGDATPINAWGTGKATASPDPNPYTSGPPISVTAGGALVTDSSGQPVPYATPWINSGSFQLICAGPDGQFGPGGEVSKNGLPWYAVAETAVTGQILGPDARLGERDNLTNFAKGPLGQ